MKRKLMVTIGEKRIASLAICFMTMCCPALKAQEETADPPTIILAGGDTLTADSGALASVEDLVFDGEEESLETLQEQAQGESLGVHEQLKQKYVEGSAEFMSLVALALVIGLTLCIERIIYLTLSEINAKKLLGDIEKKLDGDDLEGAKNLCRETRGPVAGICYQGLMYADEDMATVERGIVSYGTVLSGRLEKGCSWIRLMIAIAPSLGFLGTVIGMVMAFDQIQEAGDISPTIVADGMKVALITTIFGIVVALVLQIFYNYILSKIERITSQMEESAITLLDMLLKRKKRLKA